MDLIEGPFHHEPRAAGVFVPGLAQAHLGDRDLPNIMSQKTLVYGQTGSQESLMEAAPTPRRLELATQSSFSSPDVRVTLEQSAAAEACLMSPNTGSQAPVAEASSHAHGLLSLGVPLEASAKTMVLSPTGEQVVAPSPPAEHHTPPPVEPSSLQAEVRTPAQPEPKASPSIPAPAQPASPVEPPPPAPPVLEGTMYTDGTYWKTLL